MHGAGVLGPVQLACGDSLPQLCAPLTPQEKVTRFLAIQRDKGREIKSELRHARGYRNPDFLQKMVDDLEIHNAGSNFPKDVFDPDALHKEVRCLGCL